MIVSPRRFLQRLLLSAALVSLATFVASAQDASAQDKAIGDFPKLSATDDWPWWRGPTRNGVAPPGKYPVKFGDGENLKWKVPVPGRGHSSPVVVGKLVFLTTADERQKIHSVLSFDRATGKQLSKIDVSTGAFPEHNHPKNTEATPTVACDGERIYASFYHHDKVETVALNMDGSIAWKRDAGRFRPTRYEYGYAPSPVLYKDTVIVAGEWDGPSFLVAFDRKTGEPKWKTDRPDNITFSTPSVGHIGGRDLLLLSGADKVAAFNPATGKDLWSVPGTTAATCGTIVWDGPIAFASGGYPKAETLAVDTTGTGKVLWKNNQKCYEQSLIVAEGHVYGLTGQGVMFCWRGKDGKEMWKQRLSGPVSASPILAGGHIYWADEVGTMYVFKPNPAKFDLAATNQVGNDSFASPAACGGEIFLRVAQRDGAARQEFLYCFGQ
jgi:outer membrane protein assembly factor BamB